MASINLVILSSSPPRQLRLRNMSSSPQLPSPTEAFKKASTALRCGSNPRGIPGNVSTSFATKSAYFNQAAGRDAPNLVRTSSLAVDKGLGLFPEDMKKVKVNGRALLEVADCDEAKPNRKPRNNVQKDDISASEKGAKKATKPRGKRSAKVAEESSDMKEVVAKKPRAKRKDKADTEGPVDEVLKQKKVRKPRATKVDKDSQSKLANGKITKSIAKKKSVKSGTTSGTEIVDLPSQSADTDGFGLVEAVKRRITWTPPKPTPRSVHATPYSADILNTALAASSPAHPNGFSDLLGAFGFPSIGKPEGVIKSNCDAATRKRKLIELFKTSTTDAAAQPREKAVRKKPKTITEQATSVYATKEIENPESAPLLQYFSCQTTGQVADGFQIPSKTRAKNPIKKKATATSKKNSAKASSLLSPESAMKQVGNLDFVFGTSSQLAREESPTFLRNIHEAMQASNEVHALDALVNPLDEGSASSFRWGKVVPSDKSMLWSAASRGMDGGFLEVEMIDLSESPAIPKQLVPISVRNRVEKIVDSVDESSSMEILSNSRAAEVTKESSTKTRNVGPVEAAIRAELLSSPPSSKAVESDCFRPVKPATQPILKAQKPTPALPQTTAPKMPDFDAYTTVKLAKEIASYHFKPVKSRQQMITLLQKCWEGKQRTALSVLNTNFATKSPAKTATSPRANPEQESPKRARGRPRKDCNVSSPTKHANARVHSKNAHSIEYLELDSDTPLSQLRTPTKPRKKSTTPEEISDSEGALTPSPPRRHASQVEGGPLPLPLKSPAKASPELSDLEAQALLFRRITNAIRHAPPSKDPKEPSWHEKILLYDPIILEDLAAWLNTGAMEKVGWDGEVAAWEVKKWCESKSICCLWKENLRGGTRSRY